MKLLKTITAGFLVWVLANSAHATTYITGSTAFRSNTHTAITKIFDAGTLQYAYLDNASGTGTLGNTSAAIFEGTVGGTATTIKTHWSGSEGGIQTVSQNLNVTFLDDATPVSPGGTKLDSATALTDSHIPDVAMSDTFQSSSAFKTTKLNSTAKTKGIGPAQIVGVVPFEFVTNKGAPNSLNNLTSQNARALFAVGKAGLALFTGKPADETFTVYATGRDIDSGTRLTTLAETGLGALATVKQYQPQKGGVKAVTSDADGSDLDSPPYHIWPIETVNGITEPLGDGGYNSGGQLALAMDNTTVPTSNTCFLTYLGVNDATSVIGGGANGLTYNGYGYSSTAIQEGQYTFWGYEHLYYRDNIVTNNKFVADKLAVEIFAVDAPTPHFSDMKATRKTDGSVVLPLF